MRSSSRAATASTSRRSPRCWPPCPAWPSERVAHPDADDRLHPDRLDADVVVLYDLPGVRLARGRPAEPFPPPPEVVEGWEGLLAQGVPVVALHHSLCSWPLWPRFADLLGGVFLYAPGKVVGQDWPDSGYRLDVPQVLTVVAPEHPVCAGLPPVFALTDEPYLCPIFEDAVTPLLRTDAPRTDADHESVAHALVADLECDLAPPARLLARRVDAPGRAVDRRLPPARRRPGRVRQRRVPPAADQRHHLGRVHPAMTGQPG